MIFLSAGVTQAGVSELRILKDIKLNNENQFRFAKDVLLQNRAYCELNLNSPIKRDPETYAIIPKEPILIEAGTIFKIEKVEYKDFVAVEIPFVNKSIQTVITLTSGDTNIETSIVCNPIKYYLRRATALENKIKLNEALTTFSSILN